MKEEFDVSLVSASLRTVQLSDYHAAVVGLRGGAMACIRVGGRGIANRRGFLKALVQNL